MKVIIKYFLSVMKLSFDLLDHKSDQKIEFTCLYGTDILVGKVRFFKPRRVGRFCIKWFKKAYPKYEHSRFTTGVTTKAGSLSSAFDLSLFHDFKLTKPVRNDLLLGNFAYVNINWDIKYSQEIFKFYINDCNALGWRKILLTQRLSEISPTSKTGL